jgi:hypothetical protein
MSFLKRHWKVALFVGIAVALIVAPHSLLLHLFGGGGSLALINDTTGYETVPLQSGGSNQPSITLGNQYTWDLSTVPIMVGGGGQMANYMLCLLMTFYGSVVQSGSTGVVITDDALTTALVSSVQLQGAWHGSPLQQTFCIGAYLPIIEYLGAGFRLPRRVPCAIAAANGTHNFNHTILIPLAIGNVAKPYQTAQLALMYKKASFIINMNAGTVLAGISPGATFAGTGGTGSMTMQISAVLEPQPNLLLAPGNEWIDYQSPASAGQSQIPIFGFGNQTGLVGTNPNAGITDLFAISNGSGTPLSGLLPGSFDPAGVQSYQWGWRGQNTTFHAEAIAAMQFLALGPSKQGWFGPENAPTAIDGQGFPYINSSNAAQPSNASPLSALYGFPLVTSTGRMLLSKVQTAGNNEMFTLTLKNGFSFSGQNHTFGRHVRSFSPDKILDWQAQVIASGMASALLGTNNIALRQKTLSRQRVVPAKQLNFVPWYAVPASAAA